MKPIIFTLPVLAALSAFPAIAADEHAGHADNHNPAATSAPAHTGHGRVISVDGAARTVRIAHDPMPSLKWPKMTMNFEAHDVAVLKGIEPGAEVDFELVKFGNAYHVVKITMSR